MKKVLFLLAMLFMSFSIVFVGQKPIKTEIYGDYIEPKNATAYMTEKIRKEISVQNLKVLNSSSVKSYMDYKLITDITSPQYSFIHNNMRVCDDGFLRDKDNYIGVALGSYFGDIGDRFLITLSSGKFIPVVMIDLKSNEHTDINNFSHTMDGSIIEFVIEPLYMNDKVGENGLIYNGNFNNCEDFKGSIVEIIKIVGD